jgi:hypothetical protein
MSNFSHFKSWLSKALKTRLIFVNQEGNLIVSDGYVAFNLRGKSYLDELKMQTFQELDKNFSILYRQIDFKRESFNFLDVFKALKEGKETPVFIEVASNKSAKFSKARLFYVDDKQVLIDENFIKNLDMKEFQIFGTDGLTPIVFKSKDFDYAVLPVRNKSNLKISIS